MTSGPDLLFWGLIRLCPALSWALKVLPPKNPVVLGKPGQFVSPGHAGVRMPQQEPLEARSRGLMSCLCCEPGQAAASACEAGAGKGDTSSQA